MRRQAIGPHRLGTAGPALQLAGVESFRLAEIAEPDRRRIERVQRCHGQQRGFHQRQTVAGFRRQRAGNRHAIAPFDQLEFRAQHRFVSAKGDQAWHQRENGSECGQHLGFAGHVAGAGGEHTRWRPAQHSSSGGQCHAFVAVGDASAQPLQPRAGCQCEALRRQPQGKMFQIVHALRTMMQRRAGSSPPAAACAGNPASHSGKAGSCAATSAKPCRA